MSGNSAKRVSLLPCAGPVAQLRWHGAREMSESKSGWPRKFEEPIALPSGSKLVTLCDAASYITGLPRAEAELPEQRRRSL